MNEYHFNFNNGKSSLTIMIWLLTTLLTVATTLISVFTPIFPRLSLISFPLLLVATYQLIKRSRARQSTDIISFNKEGFTSNCFGTVLFSEISVIQVAAKDLSLLGGAKYEYYLQTEVSFPHIEFSISTQNGKTIKWILQEWGGPYNSKEDFLTFFNFLMVLADHLHSLFHTCEANSKYLKILDEDGHWERSLNEH